MSLFQTIIKCDESKSAKIASEMIERGRPIALWIVMMHAAAWHEQRTYDTPHSTIATYATHRMVEELGPNADILSEESDRASINVPEELRITLQKALVERNALHLAAIDHWKNEHGPRYTVDARRDSPNNLIHSYTQSIREKSLMGSLRAAFSLTTYGETLRFTRRALTLAAEKPDSLGHGFIMPFSLLSELPEAKFSLPHKAILWHLSEYMVRKVPNKQPEDFQSEGVDKKLAARSDLSNHTKLVTNAIVNYGILGHNGIFAHRIDEAARKGLVDQKVMTWLIDRLKQNVGETKELDKLEPSLLIQKTQGATWEKTPSFIEVPHAQTVRKWFENNYADYWTALFDAKSITFEELIQDIKGNDWDLIRAAQFAMCSLNGSPNASHVVIFTQAVWNLVDKKLVSNKLAALQVHRMLREYLKGR
ncbi:MAG: hypothetical protein GF411_07065 [Candidatus Lokiarchaeota archaeon]|nr:hypothetical protein [Candidatus Lokiarchaeota archaeon]